MKNTQFSLTTLGEILIDFTPIKEHIQNHNGNPCFEQNPGGAPANVLACFAKLGGKASFIGAVGRDSFGSFLKNVLDEQNINSEGLIIKDNADTTLAFVHLSENGDRSFSFYRRPGADTQIAIEDVPIHLVEQSDIFHFGTLSLTNEPSRSATLYAVQKAAAAQQQQVVSSRLIRTGVLPYGSLWNLDWNKCVVDLLMQICLKCQKKKLKCLLVFLILLRQDKISFLIQLDLLLLLLVQRGVHIVIKIVVANYQRSI